jgi:ketosteroid isomerase-like protein
VVRGSDQRNGNDDYDNEQTLTKRGGLQVNPDVISTNSEADTVKLLDRFADAWNRHDLDALMSMMTDDCVFQASAGPDVDGQRSNGQQAVRAAFADVFDTFPDAHWANPTHFLSGNRAVSEWTFTGTRKDGSRVEVTGCDLLTLRNGKIAVKNSYRKNRPAQHPV